MHLASDYIHPTPHQGRCRVRIYEPGQSGDHYVLVITELEDNSGQSVTNAIEQLAGDHGWVNPVHVYLVAHETLYVDANARVLSDRVRDMHWRYTSTDDSNSLIELTGEGLVVDGLDFFMFTRVNELPSFKVLYAQLRNPMVSAR